MPQPRTLILCALLAAGFLWPAMARSATWELEATVSNERKTEVTNEGSDRTETFKQSYTISYETEINPVLRLGLEFTLDVTDEINEGPEPEGDFDTREIKPDLDADLEGVWWDIAATYEFTKQTSDDPEQEKTVDEGWLVEFTAEPEGDVLPDAKIKFERVRTEEGGQPEAKEDRIEGSLDHTVWDLLDFTFDFKKNRNRNPDAQPVPGDEIAQIKEDRSYNFEVSLDKEIWESVKIELAWSNERNQSVEFFEDTFLAFPDPIIAGEVTSREDTLKNNVKGKITYSMLDDLELSLDREIDWSKDLELDTLEVTDTWTSEASYSRALTETVDVDLSYSDERKDTRGTDSNSYGIIRDYGVALDFSPLEKITFSPSFDRSDKVEWFDDSAQVTDRSVDDKWEVQMETAFWKDQVEFSVTRSFATTTEKGTRTTHERNWDVDLTFTFEGVPNLELSPKYTYTEDKDLLAQTTDEERKLEVGLKYELTLGEVTTFTVDHTYSRTSKDPAEGQSSIERDDDSDLTLAFEDFFEGMSLELGLTRTASDESGDDEGPTVDYTYNLTYDYDIVENYTFSFEYQFDKKGDAEDSRSFLTSLSAEFLEGLLTVDVEHEFEEQLQGDTKDSHRYLIEVTGKF